MPRLIVDLPNYGALNKASFTREFLKKIDNPLHANYVLQAQYVLFHAFQDYLIPDALKGLSYFKTDVEVEIPDGHQFAYSSNGMDWILGSLTREMLRDWSQRYSNEEPYHSSDAYIKHVAENGYEHLTESVLAYAQHQDYGSDFHFNVKTCVPVFWVWEILLEFLEQTQETANNKAKSANFFALGEEKAAIEMSKVKFVLQTADNDYQSIRDNMDAQQSAENFRNWRSIIGKTTSLYQNDVQTVMEARSQFMQISTKFMQDMSSMANSITRIG